MKDLLFLVHRIPYPPNKGDKIRSFHFLKYLALSYRVHLGTFIDDANDRQYVDKVDALCATTCYKALNPFMAKIASARGLVTGEALSMPYYRNKAMQLWVDETLKKYAIKNVLIFSSVMGQFIRSDHDVAMVVDFVDIDSDKWRQYAEKKRGLAQWIYQREAAFLFKYEQALANRAKISAFVSKQEAELFKTLAPDVSHKISYINNGVNVDYFSPEQAFASPYSDEKWQILVFTGAMDYWANVEAVVWFVEQVLTEIVKTNPWTRFYIVGAKPTQAVQNLVINKHVIVTGAVSDVRPYLAYAHLVVAPLRIARGIQNKVLEAMSMAKALVATSAAMEGIAATVTSSLVVCDDVNVMVQQINTLLISHHNIIVVPSHREFVKANFSWENNLPQLLALLD